MFFFFKFSVHSTLQTVKAAAKAVPILEIDSDERLLVHIGYSPRRYPILQSCCAILIDVSD